MALGGCRLERDGTNDRLVGTIGDGPSSVVAVVVVVVVVVVVASGKGGGGGGGGVAVVGEGERVVPYRPRDCSSEGSKMATKGPVVSMKVLLPSEKSPSSKRGTLEHCIPMIYFLNHPKTKILSLSLVLSLSLFVDCS